MLRGLFSAIAVAALASTLGTAHAVEPGAPKELLGRMDAAAFKLQTRLSETFRDIPEAERRERGAMAEFYAERGADFLWVDEDGLNDRAKAVAGVVARAAKFDLRPENYALPDMSDTPPAGDKAAWLASAEYLISRTVLAYARHAQSGHVDPRSISRILDITPDAPDPFEVLRGLAREQTDVADYLEAFHPQHPQFTGLLERLNALRAASQRASVTIPDGDVIKPGETHPHVALLRKRLGVDEAVDSPNTYGPELAAAVERFQKRNGLHVDGLIGPATRRALNLSHDDKIETIRVNLERWRWFPNTLGARHVHVNIPEFVVRVVDDGKTAFEERIVVGKPKHATPSFSDEMELVVFNPYWNVPYSIMKNEIVPVARRDPSYLSRQNLSVVWRGGRTVDPYRVDWSEVDLGKVRLRQSPGSHNALGEVKFLFPNKHSVYLHDTPSKHLFSRTQRAFSHGCMRVRNPRKFAEALMGAQELCLVTKDADGRTHTRSVLPVAFVPLIAGDRPA
jgi:murein L,D-transpeptidase YcbB/YkuD